jgi:hypothetical protein
MNAATKLALAAGAALNPAPLPLAIALPAKSRGLTNATA